MTPVIDPALGARIIASARDNGDSVPDAVMIAADVARLAAVPVVVADVVAHMRDSGLDVDDDGWIADHGREMPG